MEAFHVAVLPRTTGFDEEGLDPLLLQPIQQESGNKLGSVVRTDVGGGPVLLNEFLHDLPCLLRSDVAVDVQGVDLTGVFVNHAQHPEGAAFYRPIVDEIPAPHVSTIRSLLWMAARGLAYPY